MKKLCLHGTRLLCLILTFTLLLSTSAFALSPPEADKDWKSGSFHYVLSSDDDLEDVYLYSDSWFSTDASVENPHLRTLSLIAAMASASSNAKDYPLKSANLQALLQGLGFEDIAVNAYYTVKPTMSSAGCCIAHKQIGDSTLLAIFPRSQGYEAEWGGNFNVGTDGLHSGFKEARDEVLRFARQYVTEYGISGNLKVWIAGHSRGAAIANLTAGFLAACPGWLGDLDAKDLYAYTFGTPAGIRADVTAAEVCPVAEVKENDPSGATPGGGSGVITCAVNPHDAAYNCIRNYYSSDDIFTRVVPAAWNFTRYGTDTVFNDAWSDAAALAARYEGVLDPDIRNSALFGDPAEGFAEKALTNEVTIEEASGTEKSTFSISPVTVSTLTPAQFMDERIAMLNAAAGGSQKSYVSDGYQAALTKLCTSIFGKNVETEALLETLMSHPEDAADLVAGALGVYIYSMYFKAESLENSDMLINQLQTQLGILSLGFTMKQDTIRPLLQNILGDTEFGTALTEKLMTTLPYFLADAMLYSVPEGMTHSEAMLDITASKLQTVLSKYGFAMAQSEMQAAVRTLAFTLFSTDDTSFKLPINVTISLSTLETEIQIDPDTAELNTAVTLLGNIAAFGRAHINADILCWMRAMDSAYLLYDLPPGNYDKSQTLHLFGADGAKLYYTMDGSQPTKSSTLYADRIVLPKIASANHYPLRVISVGTDGTVSPVWSLDYTIGSGIAAPIDPPHKNQDPEGSSHETPVFSDVAADAYYSGAVAWAVANDITRGTSNTTFSPNASCTRAQVVTFLWRAAGCPAAADAASFTDVADDAYYAAAVAWAIEQGITKGTSDTTFSPNDFCSRAQFVTFLWRAAGCPAAANASTFADVAADSYYAAAVAWAVEQGITKGTSNTTFSPDDFCSRAQVVTFLWSQK